jgi:beclin
MKPTAGASGKGGAVYPSLPRLKCQECRRALVVVGVESYADRLPAHAAPGTRASPPASGLPVRFIFREIKRF